MQYAVENLAVRGLLTALIDSDIGQSSIGLPGMIATQTFRKLEDLDASGPDSMFFIRDTNPSLSIQRIIEGR